MFMDAMAQRPALQGVVTVSNYIKADAFNCPANVVIVSEAPQVELLKRASLMVSHGGVTGLKKSAFMGVPMLLIPIHYDEFGNAARVVYHGLGVRLQLEKVSAVELGRLLIECSKIPPIPRGRRSCQRDSSNLSGSLLELQSSRKHLKLAQCL